MRERVLRRRPTFGTVTSQTVFRLQHAIGALRAGKFAGAELSPDGRRVVAIATTMGCAASPYCPAQAANDAENTARRHTDVPPPDAPIGSTARPVLGVVAAVGGLALPAAAPDTNPAATGHRTTFDDAALAVAADAARVTFKRGASAPNGKSDCDNSGGQWLPMRHDDYTVDTDITNKAAAGSSHEPTAPRVRFPVAR